MTSTTEIVKLNIGGTIFQTTKSTLTRFDGFFRTILETDVPVTKDEFGALFIDRSPKHFDLILNFMRDGDVKLPGCKDSIEEISKEAQYYLLTELVELCSKQSQTVKPNNELFKMLNSEDEELLTVLNSKKPVLVIRSSQVANGRHYNQWKKLIEKHSPKWNIFFRNEEKHLWCIHNEEKVSFSCCSWDYQRKIYSCNYPSPDYSIEVFIIHLEYHMNRCLTHPENMRMKYEEYARFLNQ